MIETLGSARRAAHDLLDSLGAIEVSVRKHHTYPFGSLMEIRAAERSSQPAVRRGFVDDLCGQRCLPHISTVLVDTAANEQSRDAL